mmetsp:Transcript_13956/g.17108  ORF Transcript_13956/g.17108 Transcript_13956/m.17108 type:complete len:111 (+) Transcript_13956:73-405(+)
MAELWLITICGSTGSTTQHGRPSTRGTIHTSIRFVSWRVVFDWFNRSTAAVVAGSSLKSCSIGSASPSSEDDDGSPRHPPTLALHSRQASWGCDYTSLPSWRHRTPWGHP